MRVGGHAFAQNTLGARVTFAAARADFQLVTQLRHRRHAAFDGLADFSVRNVVAYTDNHQSLLPLSLSMKNTQGAFRYLSLHQLTRAPVTNRVSNLNLSGFVIAFSTTVPHCSDNCWQVARNTGANSGKSASAFKCRSITDASLMHEPDS
jgi:hypothetical protein